MEGGLGYGLGGRRGEGLKCFVHSGSCLLNSVFAEIIWAANFNSSKRRVFNKTSEKVNY